MKLQFLILLIFTSQAFAGGVNKYVPKDMGIVKPVAQPKAAAIYDSAKTTKAQNQAAQIKAKMISSALNSAGKKLISKCCTSKKCASQCPVGIALVVMGGMASQQAKSHGGTARQAGSTMAATDAFSNGEKDSYNDGKKVGADGFGFVKIGEDLASGFKKNKIPVTFDGKNLVGPNGLKIGPDDVMSASSMAAAGLSKDNISSISAELSNADKAADNKVKYTTPDFGFSEGGGGGAFGSSPTSGETAEGMNQFGSEGQAELGSMNAKAETSGLTKDYNGDPIGVSNDSIFNMMTRRYQLKERQATFLMESKAPAQK